MSALFCRSNLQGRPSPSQPAFVALSWILEYTNPPGTINFRFPSNSNVFRCTTTFSFLTSTFNNSCQVCKHSPVACRVLPCPSRFNKTSDKHFESAITSDSSSFQAALNQTIPPNRTIYPLKPINPPDIVTILAGALERG